jgi:hypothetical protein
VNTNDPICTVSVQGRAISANARLGTRGRARVYLTKQAREWRENVAGCAFAEWTVARFHASGEPRLPLRVVVHVRGGRGDADNYAKLILDGLADGIHINDRYFNPIEVCREPKGLGPAGVTIEVWEAEADKAA